jgi:hypothetical protein
MKARTVAVAALVAAVLLTGQGVTGSADHRDPAQAACKRARIGGRMQCLATGRRCQPRYEHLYELYAFTCRRAQARGTPCHRRRGGGYRLRERIFIGTPTPAPKRQ